jgi:predicted lipoprotein with Yx(FWY)xxD motif
MNKRAALVLAAFTAASSLALAGCGGGGGGSTSGSSSPASSSGASSSAAGGGDAYGSGGSSSSGSSSSGSSSAQAGGEVELKTSTVGGQKIIVDEKGMTVYYYTRDNKGATVSACTGGCITLWPPVISSESPKLDGVTATVGSIKTPEGKNQVTLNGMPIYYYQKDTGPGQVNGQAVAGVWYVVGADGTMITSALK